LARVLYFYGSSLRVDRLSDQGSCDGETINPAIITLADILIG